MKNRKVMQNALPLDLNNMIWAYTKEGDVLGANKKAAKNKPINRVEVGN